MSREVEIDEQTAQRLAELRAAIEAETGEAVSSGDVVARLVEDACESSAPIDASSTTTVPLSDEEKSAMARGRISSGVETDEEDVDDVLYGRETDTASPARERNP